MDPQRSWCKFFDLICDPSNMIFSFIIICFLLFAFNFIWFSELYNAFLEDNYSAIACSILVLILLLFLICICLDPVSPSSSQSSSRLCSCGAKRRISSFHQPPNTSRIIISTGHHQPEIVVYDAKAPYMNEKMLELYGHGYKEPKYAASAPPAYENY